VDKRANAARLLVLLSTVSGRSRWVGAGRRVDDGGGGCAIRHAHTVSHRVVHASSQSLSPGDRADAKLTRSGRCAFVAAPKRRRERIHEAHLPTQSYPAPAHPRLPRADELAGRPACDCTTASQGPPPAGAYHLQEVAFRAEMSAPTTATRPRRLRRSMRRADFLRVSELGQRISARYFLVLVLERRPSECGLREFGSPAGSTRLGITVTRRVGKAVRRNRIKRLVREWFRSSQERLQKGWQGYDLVVIAKREIPERLSFAEARADLDRALLERPRASGLSPREGSAQRES
jgi:ribonuclease P protein component